MGSTLAVRTLTDEVRKREPLLVFLVKTKARVGRIRGIQAKLNYTQGIVVPSDGRSGGLALLWKEGVDRFTWCNGRHGNQRTKLRLDRMVANVEWMRLEIKGWDVNLVRNTFLPHEADMVLGIPISPRLPEDSIVWAWTSNGLFSVKSAYKIVLFRSFSSSSSDSPKTHPDPNNQPNQTAQPKLHVISSKPHISSQFYTFNPKSHSLMIRCLLKHCLAMPTEIRVATPRAVLKSWRAVWKDRNEDTAYLTYAFDDKEKE
ncbi:hypothetical protein CFP56_017473 [Quercus suber]|uniref:Uncharacterized protein n=1 Tax=Quercus suber TaxID=58331 RepID=A0AAW0KLJ9_QUESU